MSSLVFQKLRNRVKRRLWSLPLSVPSPFKTATPRDPSIGDEISAYEATIGGAHAGGTLPLRTLLRIEEFLPAGQIHSAETGCGKSTIFFSRISEHHKTFCLDDRDIGAASSVAYFADCPATRMGAIETIFGPTQATLPVYKNHTPYDLVLIDGPHGFPFPELEYYFLYPHLKTNGLLVLDDIHIPTIGRLADFLAEDRMFEMLECVDTTAIYRRTDAPVFDPLGDGWWLQDYNRRRADFAKIVHLRDGKRRAPITFEGRF